MYIILSLIKNVPKHKNMVYLVIIQNFGLFYNLMVINKTLICYQNIDSKLITKYENIFIAIDLL